MNKLLTTNKRYINPSFVTEKGELAEVKDTFHDRSLLVSSRELHSHCNRVDNGAKRKNPSFINNLMATNSKLITLTQCRRRARGSGAASKLPSNSAMVKLGPGGFIERPSPKAREKWQFRVKSMNI